MGNLPSKIEKHDQSGFQAEVEPCPHDDSEFYVLLRDDTGSEAKRNVGFQAFKPPNGSGTAQFLAKSFLYGLIANQASDRVDMPQPRDATISIRSF
jgi:hypothetical protein